MNFYEPNEDGKIPEAEHIEVLYSYFPNCKISEATMAALKKSWPYVYDKITGKTDCRKHNVIKQKYVEGKDDIQLTIVNMIAEFSKHVKGVNRIVEYEHTVYDVHDEFGGYVKYKMTITTVGGSYEKIYTVEHYEGPGGGHCYHIRLYDKNTGTYSRVHN